MSPRLEFLALLQEVAVKLRQLARELPSSIAAELLRMANDTAAEAALVEAELLDDGLLDGVLTSPRAVNQN